MEEAACDIKMELKNYFLFYSDSAAVVAAITVGIDAYPAQPGDIAHALPTPPSYCLCERNHPVYLTTFHRH